MTSETRPQDEAPAANVSTENVPAGSAPTDNAPRMNAAPENVPTENVQADSTQAKPQKRQTEDDPRDHEQNKRQKPAPKPVERDSIRRAMGTLFPGYRREKLGFGKLSEARNKVKAYVDETEKNADLREEMTGRLLTAFLNVLPEEQGRVNIVTDILCTEGRRGLEALCDGIINHLIRPIRKAAGATPNLCPERDSFHQGRHIDTTINLVQHSEGCLYRDFEVRLLNSVPARLDAHGDENPSEWAEYLQALHIVPYGLSPPTRVRRGLASNVDWYNSQPGRGANIYRYFPALELVLDIREYDIINTPRNGVTLTWSLSRLMADFAFSLEYQGDNYDPDDLYAQHSYKLVTFGGTRCTYSDTLRPLESGERIDFGGEYRDEAPHPRIMDFHLAIARILDATGLRQCLAAMPEELTEMSACANDGSTDLGTLVQKSLEDNGIEVSGKGRESGGGAAEKKADGKERDEK